MKIDVISLFTLKVENHIDRSQSLFDVLIQPLN